MNSCLTLALALTLAACGGQEDGPRVPASTPAPDAPDASSDAAGPDASPELADGAPKPAYCSRWGDTTPCAEGLSCANPFLLTPPDNAIELVGDWACAPSGVNATVTESECGPTGPVGPSCTTNEIVPCCRAAEAGCYCLSAADY